MFRDDLVFCVYIYQRWAYRVDKRRANEFGCASEFHAFLIIVLLYRYHHDEVQEAPLPKLMDMGFDGLHTGWR